MVRKSHEQYVFFNWGPNVGFFSWKKNQSALQCQYVTSREPLIDNVIRTKAYKTAYKCHIPDVLKYYVVEKSVLRKLRHRWEVSCSTSQLCPICTWTSGRKTTWWGRPEEVFCPNRVKLFTYWTLYANQPAFYCLIITHLVRYRSLFPLVINKTSVLLPLIL